MGQLYKSALSFVNDWKMYSDHTSSCAKISVIIPTYKPTHLSIVLKQLSKLEKNLEVILVDDSGNDTPLLNDKYTELSVKIIKHDKNYGRPAARNTGAAYASGDILVFIDQDMILAPDFFAQAIKLILSNNGKGIVLGLRHTLPYSEILFDKNWRRCSIFSDWRVSTPVLPSFIDLTVAGVGSTNNNCEPNKLLNIYHKTNHLRDFGVAPERTLGFWDLPSMVISHSMAITKDEFFRIGGFPEWISGWGGEDIALGFSAIAARNPIMITETVSYHIQHPPYSGSENKKILELTQNIKRYKQWARSVDTYPSINLSHWKNRATQIFF